MDKTYQPKQIEDHWYRIWEESGVFKPKGDGDPYCIVIPPPNVTGRLHMGHGFQHAIMDALIRYHRMLGRACLWQVGTDHAGIATQMVVERQLNAAGSDRQQVGRDEFVRRVWKWKEQSGDIITRQLRRMGSSTDWSRERFTMDRGFSSVVEKVFIDLYEEGLIYRGNRLVNWDPQLQTAISDLEVISEEEEGSLWYFNYPVVDGDAVLTVATTRPETMLGDTAVAVHPEDPRYQHVVGKQVLLPLVNRSIPVIADDSVDRDFGTGCVKITPAHDFNDYAMGRRHNLDVINVLTPDARINEKAPVSYRGMERFAVREKIVADMQQQGLLDRVEPHKLKVPRGDRSGVVIEPYLTPQWYVAVKTLAEPAIAAVKNGDIEFVPKNWENTYFAWMRDIEDWCISRQLWWGHRIPAWYDERGNVYVGHSEAELREKHRLDPELPLRQDGDVLDTWFSSALWSFTTLGWPDDRDWFHRFHPTDVLVTGFDIIFFWVARMIMMTLKFTGEIPFRKIYITGLVRDENGQKMSKSKGNILDPIDLIDGINLEDLVAKRTADVMQTHIKRKIVKQTKDSFPRGIEGYGVDALRYTFYSLASTGRDIKFDIGRIKGFRNFCNKIWNAARYALMNTENKEVSPCLDYPNLSVTDKWILGRMQDTVKAIRDAMASYRFDMASQALHEFVWDEYCDWYVELSKPVIWNDQVNSAQAASTRRVLLVVLEQSLRLLHPFMPFITEEIWQKVTPQLGIAGESIMLQPYPEFDEAMIDPVAAADVGWLKGIVLAIRNIRGELNISPARSVEVLLRGTESDTQENDRRRLEVYRPFLQKMAKLDSVRWLKFGEETPLSATSVAGSVEILVPMLDLIEVEPEKARMKKEIALLKDQLEGINVKLANEKFLRRAPAVVVDKQRQRQKAVSELLESLQVRLGQLP